MLNLSGACCSQAELRFHKESVNFKLEKLSESAFRDLYCKVSVDFALHKRHFDIAVILLQSIADEKLRDHCCLTSIISAARFSDLHAVNLLLSNILDKSLQDALRYFQMSLSDESHQYECSIKLAKYATDSGNLEILQSILEIISDDGARDKWRIKLLDAATELNNFEIMILMVQVISDQKLRQQSLVKVAKSAANSSDSNFVAAILRSFKDDLFHSTITESFAKHGNLNMVKLCIESVVNVDFCCSTAAESAAIFGHVEVTEFLIRSMSDQKLKDKCCMTAVKSAAGNGHMKSVVFLLRSISNQTERDPSCTKAVESAVKNGHLEVAKYCLSLISDQNIRDQCCIKTSESSAFVGRSEDALLFIQTIANSDIRAQCCITVAKSAAAKLHLHVIQKLLCTIEDPSLKDQCCMAAAESAAKNGHLELLKLCVQSIIDPNARDQCCMKAAEFAAVSGRLDLMKYLVQTIVDPNLKDQCCRKEAKSAAAKGHLKLVNYLLNAIAVRELLASCRYETVAASLQSGNFLVAETIGIEPQWLLNSLPLRQYIANCAITGNISKSFTQAVSKMDSSQITRLLSISISNGHIALALMLLPYVSKVDLPDSSGATALMLAADVGQHELVDRLLNVGASVSFEDSQGRTALSRACQAGHLRVAKLLAEKGADVAHCDHDGMTCFELAEKFGHRLVSRLFISELAGFSGASTETDSNFHKYSNEKLDSKLSSEMHRLLNAAGFTLQRAVCQQAMANLLQGIAREITRDNMQLTGSYAEGWANSLVQVNGRTGADSDIDWTIILPEPLFHLDGGCDGKRSECKGAAKLKVEEGHAQAQLSIGSQPAITARSCGVRPAQDTCHAYACCSFYGHNPLGKRNASIQLVRATRPNKVSELRLGFSLIEKDIIRKLNGIQGQLFTTLKFIIKRYLPCKLATHGLKTYHAKTIVLSMLSKTKTDWKAKNLVKLLKESLDMMFKFMNSSISPDECMPHFFISDAKLYFKNAGIGGHFQHTKAMVSFRLKELISDLTKITEEMKKCMKPLQSDNFYFHPFTLLPLTRPPAANEIRQESEWDNQYVRYADIYSVVFQCLTDMQSESCETDSMKKQLSHLHQHRWCRSASQCLTVMAHLRFGDHEEAKKLINDLTDHKAHIGWSSSDIEKKRKYDKHFGHWYWNCPEDTDWAWRFCVPWTTQPHFPFLPKFTQTLLTARLMQPCSSHLYVNFRCLSWSLQAELLSNHTTPTTLTAWLNEMQEDPDLEELLTLAHYSDCCEHLQFCLRNMEAIRTEGRIAMETQDFEKLEQVKTKLQRLQTEKSNGGSVSVIASAEIDTSVKEKGAPSVLKMKRPQSESADEGIDGLFDLVNDNQSKEGSPKLSNGNGTASKRRKDSSSDV